MPEDRGGEGHGQGPIYKKVKKIEGGHHGGAWKVAYADLVTALMALFIVLWILSQSDEVKQSVAGYFRDPVGFKEGGVTSVVEGGSEAATIKLIESDTARSGGDGQEEMFRDRATRIREALAGLDSFSKYEKQIELAITPEGLRISLIESRETPLFQVGGTVLNQDAKEILETIGKEVVELERHMVIEGHTDSLPYAASSGMSNWELSTGRAHTARKVLTEAGVDASLFFEVRGFADHQLYNPLDPQDSRNRRVSITLYSDEAFEARQEVGKTTVIN
jgi:chemotaxis protein MotB